MGQVTHWGPDWKLIRKTVGNILNTSGFHLVKHILGTGSWSPGMALPIDSHTRDLLVPTLEFGMELI